METWTDRERVRPTRTRGDGEVFGTMQSSTSWLITFVVVHIGFGLGVLNTNFGVPAVCISALLLRYVQQKQWITPLFGGFAAVRLGLALILKAKDEGHI